MKHIFVREKPKQTLFDTFLTGLIVLGLGLLCILFITALLLELVLSHGAASPKAAASAVSYDIMDRFDMHLTNSMSHALDGVVVIKKVYWLSDNDIVAPEPDQNRFGEAEDPASLQGLLDDAAKILDGQETLFSTDTQIYKKSTVHYYLDETIFTVTWKQVIDDVVYTISEVKIAHPSQFRRFLADGEYGSSHEYLTTEMASSVNAVVASAGDFYKYRRGGIVVYNGKVERFRADKMDTCGIDENGDFIFMPQGSFEDIDQCQKFVDEHKIRFTLSFGPVLVDNFERCEPGNYVVGQGNDRYARAAICQMGELHYLLVTANAEGGYNNYPTIHSFAKRIHEFGCEKAYTIDGGQTATLVMNDRLINRVSYGSQRQISDIIYFATAKPIDH